MVREGVSTQEINQLRERLEKLSKKQLIELVKFLDIKFKGRTKAKKDEIISNIINLIEKEELSIKRIEKELSKDKYKERKKEAIQRITKKDLEKLKEDVSSELKRLHKIETKLESLIEDIRKFDRKLLELSEQLLLLKESLTLAENTTFSVLLSNFRRIALELDKPEDFDKFIKKLPTQNMNLNEVVKIGNAIVTISLLSEIIKKLRWPDDLDLFYIIVKSEFKKISTPDGTVPIYQMREIVCRKMGITPEDFNRQLIACFKKGWLTLDFRSPIGEENIEYLEVNGRNYYVIRSFRR